MRRWMVALLAVIIAAGQILLHRSSSPALLLDTDTSVLLQHIRERQDPWSWFRGDWPLFNHFYRPVSTLAFELDNRLYGNNPAGYGLTNALLCAACVLLLFWFVRELTDRPLYAALAAIWFAEAHLQGIPYLGVALTYAAYVTMVVGAIRHRRDWRRYVPACLVMLCLSDLLYGPVLLGSATIGWLPGRTALVMTVFTLISMASYARYERLGATRAPSPEPTPLDPPATRSTKAPTSRRAVVWPWILTSAAAAALALASYEQAVMLPAALLGVALTMRFQGYRVRWGWQAMFWTLLAGYLALRAGVLPAGVSGYQKQQLRTGYGGLILALTDYVLPAAGNISSIAMSLESGLLILFTPAPYLWAYAWITELTTAYQLKRQWVFGLAGWALSILTYLPMAWLKQFDHYHYWPMSLRSILIVAVAATAAELAAIAWSPPSRQAPPRLVPAPGSLPHP